MPYVLAEQTFIFVEIPIRSIRDSIMLIEIGHFLKMERIKQGLSVEDICKKIGARALQIQALEDGDTAYFEKNSKPFIWFARLYARKLRIDLPDFTPLICDGAKSTNLDISPTLPSFLTRKKNLPATNIAWCCLGLDGARIYSTVTSEVRSQNSLDVKF